MFAKHSAAMRKFLTSKRALAALGLIGGGAVALSQNNVSASSDFIVPTEFDWPHKRSILRKFDPASQRRGFEVYRQVCSTCHSMDSFYFRELIGLIHTREQAKLIAASIEVEDGPNMEGEMFKRPGRLYDPMPRPYPNDELARFVNSGASPPDLSYITRGRFGGEDYVFALLTGYKDAPAGVKLRPGQNYNPYFPGGLIAMAPPLTDGQVEWEDDTPVTVSQMAKDVTTFLAWCSSPEDEVRHLMMVKTWLAFGASTVCLWWWNRFRWGPLKTRRITFLDFPSMNDKYWKKVH